MIFLKVVVFVLLLVVIILGVWVWRGVWRDMKERRHEGRREN